MNFLKCSILFLLIIIQITPSMQDDEKIQTSTWKSRMSSDCIKFHYRCRQIYFSTFNNVNSLCGEEDSQIKCWEEHLSVCRTHPLYLQMRQEYYLECVLENRPNLKICEDQIKNAFTRDIKDVLHPSIKKYLSTFYAKNEGIGDMMQILRMPRTLSTFRPLHHLFKTLGKGNITVLCCHLLIFEDALNAVKKSKICEMNGTDKIVMKKRFAKDAAKLDYNKLFFVCDPCKCMGRCNSADHFNHSFLYLIVFTFVSFVKFFFVVIYKFN